MRATRLIVAGCLLLCSWSGAAFAGGFGISEPRDEVPEVSGSQILTVPFHLYKVPTLRSLLANRDLEFLWSDSYRQQNTPLVPPGNPEDNDLDRFGRAICDSIGNPFGFQFTDIRLVHDYMKRRYAGTDTLYKDDPQVTTGFQITSPDADPERNHADVYLWLPGSDPDIYSSYPSTFLDDVEDSLTADITTFHLNSIDLRGPALAQVGVTDQTRWTRPDTSHTQGFNHEFEHCLNTDKFQGLPFLHMLASAGEILGGIHRGRPINDVPYTWNLIREDPGGNYQAWQSFAGYVAFNFRGVDLSSSVAGRSDDLLWRWAKDADRRLVSGLAARLQPAQCAECVSKPYFTGLSPEDRARLLIHNWRVANYVNQPTLDAGQYGFPSQFNFAPNRDILNWQGVDNVAWDDSVAVPPEVTLGPAQLHREVSYAGLPPLTNAHSMSLESFGADYWVVRSDPALASGTPRDLVIRVIPEGTCTSTGMRLMATAIGYSEQNLPSGQPDSLWKHAEWAQLAVGPQSVAVNAPGSGTLELVVPGFGQTHKAALVVITLSQSVDNGAADREMPYRLNLALGTVLLSPNPRAVHAEPTTSETAPTWAPAGDELAFTSNSHLYRRRLDGSPLAELVLPPQTQKQFRPHWSPLGDWVAFDQESTQTDCNVLIYNTLTGELRRLSTSPVHEVSAVFSPDGQRLAYVRLDPPTTQLRLINLDGSGEVILVSRGGFIQSPRWTTDGKHIYFSVGDSLYAVSMGGQVIPRAHLLPQALEFDLAPGDGRLLGRGTWLPPFCAPLPLPSSFWRLILRDTVLAQSEPTLPRTGGNFYTPRWSFDGTKVAYAADQGVTTPTDVFAGQVVYNRPPVLSQVGGLTINDATPVIDTVAYLGFPLDLVVDAADPDADPLTYLAYFLRPELGMDFNPATQTFSWIPNLQTDLSVVYHLRFQVTTPSGGTDYAIARIRVTIWGGGGCPYVDTRSAQGWQKENSILGRSLTGALATDTYRLKATPQAHDGRYYLRIRENEQERTTLDQVKLLVVDHDPQTQVFPTSEGMALGERRPAYRVTTAAGVEITELVNGQGGKFRGQPGDILLVEMLAPGEAWSPLPESLLKPGVIQYDEKQGPAPGGGFRAEARLPAAIDAAILAQSGILVQVPDESDGWRTVQHLYPREQLDQAVIEAAGSGRLRLVFVGQHGLGFIGRLAAVGRATPQELPLERARHSRLGDARPAVLSPGGSLTTLDPGDTLSLEFRALAVAAGQVRDCFLVSRGVYTAWRPADEPQGVSPVPSRFALLQNQPNPFAHTTTIRFALPVTARVTLEVFDLLGRRVAALAGGEYPAGTHAVDWNRRAVTGAAAPPGVYLYRLNAGSFREQKKMVLLRP